MNFFDNLFNIREDNYYGVSGLNNELSCIYIYNAFLCLFWIGLCSFALRIISTAIYLSI